MKQTLMLLYFVMLSKFSSAQFHPKSLFVNGGMYTSFDNSRFKQSDFSSGSYRHDLNLSIGKFTKQHKAVGWGVNNSIFAHKFKGTSFKPESVKELKLGINRFWEYYKPLNDKLSLYMSPSVGLTYAKSYDYGISGYDITFESWSREMSIGASMKLGMCFRVDKRWVFYGNFGIIDPIRVTAGITKTEKYWQKNINSENIRTRSVYSDQYFVPGLASVGLGLGVRYFWGLTR